MLCLRVALLARCSACAQSTPHIAALLLSQDLPALAREPPGRAFLKALAAASSFEDVKQICSDHDYTKGRLLLQPHPGSCLVFKVVMAYEHGQWAVTGLKGPTRQTESKLFREIGSSNLISLEIEDPKDVADERAGQLPTQQGETQRLEVLQSCLNYLTDKPLVICGRKFAYCLHKVRRWNPACPQELPPQKSFLPCRLVNLLMPRVRPPHFVHS